jgi:carbamoyl-phosphate synthase large subunit
MNKVLVTGIGGNVGYGILKNIRLAYGASIELIGTNTVRVSAGNHLCDAVYEVPFSLEESYIPSIKDICTRHQVALIIPSTDYEAYVLGLHREELPTVAVSPAATTKTFLDKYLSYQRLNEAGIAFAESILPSAYDGRFGSCIVKPREGRGSRGISVNPTMPTSFSDDYIVQPLLSGKEITTAFYVTRQNALHGHITMERELSSGATSSCEVVTEYDSFLEGYILKLINSFDIKGSCNVQSIVTENGIVPFEINCRISGTNSIRTQFGFRDVAYTVDEWLHEAHIDKPLIVRGSAVRILSDIVYLDRSLSDVNNNKDNFYI